MSGSHVWDMIGSPCSEAKVWKAPSIPGPAGVPSPGLAVDSVRASLRTLGQFSGSEIYRAAHGPEECGPGGEGSPRAPAWCRAVSLRITSGLFELTRRVAAG